MNLENVKNILYAIKILLIFIYWFSPIDVVELLKRSMSSKKKDIENDKLQERSEDDDIFI